MKIADRVTLSRGVTILSVGYDTNDYRSNSQKEERDHVLVPVMIGEGTWICANVTICPGAIIPEGCIIAAGAVVSGKLSESFAMYGGVPAKLIKKL